MAVPTDVVLVVLRRPDGTGLAFDCCVKQSHELTATVTRFPVERGVAVADHVQAQPKRLTLDGIVGPAPLTLTTLGAGDLARGMPQDADRVQRAFDVLEALHEERAVIDVVTRRRTYPNMVLTRVVVSIDASTSAVLSASCVVEQIRSVESQTISLPQPSIPRGEGNKKDGRATGTQKDVREVVSSSAATRIGRTGLQQLGRLKGADAAFAAATNILGGGG